MTRNLESRVNTLENHRAGRTFIVWEGNEEAMVDARAKSGPHDQILTVGWLKEPLPT